MSFYWKKNPRRPSRAFLEWNMKLKNMFFMYKIFTSSQTERKITRRLSQASRYKPINIMNYISHIRFFHPLRRKEIWRKDPHEPFLQVYRIFISYIRNSRFPRRKKILGRTHHELSLIHRISNSTKKYNSIYKGFTFS